MLACVVMRDELYQRSLGHNVRYYWNTHDEGRAKEQFDVQQRELYNEARTFGVARARG